MTSIKKFLSVLLVMTFVFLGGCADIFHKDDASDTFHEATLPTVLSKELLITEAFLYSGEFPEDGSFRKEKDVFALKVVNRSSKDLKLVRILVTTDKKECLFEITTLPSQKAVTVLEKNAQTLSYNEKILQIREENKVFFEQKLSLESENFEITPLNSVFNIKNISNEDFSSDVYVYFKKTDADGNFFGGITFRSNAGKLKTGEFKQIPASHFTQEDSEVLFVSYAMQ